MDHNHTHDHGHDHEHNHSHESLEESGWKSNWKLLISLSILLIMLVLEYGFKYVPTLAINLSIYITAYLLAGYNVLYLAFVNAKRFDIFNEFFLMTVATIGAFSIGSFSEGVAVMVFYSIGEWFQDLAVNNAKKSIKALLNVRPNEVSLIANGTTTTVDPNKVIIGDRIQVKVGEKVALDGILATEQSSFDTAALTGESTPKSIHKDGVVLAGMINLNHVSEITVTALFKDSKLSKILEMVQDASSRKSKTHLFISKFAKIYTPIVFIFALLVCFVPYFFAESYEFQTWFYRSLVFLVISCPCALVISIPLGYFGGIGFASRNGILFKGSNFLDVISNIQVLVMDKTGTLTKGVFTVQKVVTNTLSEKEFIQLVAAIESQSTHPIAKAITAYAQTQSIESLAIDSTEEIAGHGLKSLVEGKEVLVGNVKLLQKFNITFPNEIEHIPFTTIVVAINKVYAGYITIADEIKPDALEAIKHIQSLNIQTVMLSGDKQTVVTEVAKTLGISEAYGDLLPEDKVAKVQAYKNAGKRLAFVGDGVNDAPVVALADVGIAMGGLGSDATIETADIVIQNDQPSKILTAIHIGKITKTVVWQNITLALVVKIVVLILGAGGIATLWEAVIADVGVALLAILNAVRIQHKTLK
ncbi:heavy metal translocating P-type ATPase [uncultured Cytophaga sp.]|uniref:heavy metal translocating P-type ATPase n=1 Tax=uncultured Cytophaga sp. TaxID=160238 RepID=UPI002606BB61|nr:heavy metal translocating P-type ATPase [uncultured Cytophaga sp.]